MKTIDYLEKQYGHAFEMLKFGESKNIALIAFNGASASARTMSLS